MGANARGFGISGVSAATEPCFGIDTSNTGSDAIILGNAGTGNILFEDQNRSSISGGSFGIRAENNADGLISIQSNGIIAGANIGVFARNF